MVMLIDENFVENCSSYEYKSYTLIVCLIKKKVLTFFIVFVSHTSAWILKVRKRVWCKIHMISYIKCIGKIIMGKSNWTETLFKTWKQ